LLGKIWKDFCIELLNKLQRSGKMSYIIKTQNKMYDITGLGQGEGLYNVTRVELEQLLKDIEVELMNDDYDTNGNYTKGA
jgi:hypothetical protein